MRVVTILGTRPEIIRLSRIISALDKCCEHIVVHTGQNYDGRLSDIFFKELAIRDPDYNMNVRGDSSIERIANILICTEKILTEQKPDLVVVLGDTDSALSVVVAKRMRIPVVHLEAGNRCFDDRVPEEVNRRIVDHSSDMLLPYTERSRENLIAEGIPSSRIMVIGNPIWEVLEFYDREIHSSDVLTRCQLTPDEYMLATVHRTETVDNPHRLRVLMDSLHTLGRMYGKKIICGVHPHTRKRITEFGIPVDSLIIQLHHPFGFFDFVKLEANAFCVLTDSGTVQEECCIMKQPCVVLRDVTERPETIECGATILGGVFPDKVYRYIDMATSECHTWRVPPEYLRPNVSQIVRNVVLGYQL